MSKQVLLVAVNIKFKLYHPVTRKRRWRSILDESAPA